jgi:hypothetical protein
MVILVDREQIYIQPWAIRRALKLQDSSAEIVMMVH